MSDAPELERLRSALSAAERALAEAQGELQAFMHTVSHDLRAPLRHITSYARLLKEDLGSALQGEVQTSLTAIAHAAEHQGRLIDGLMALARVRQAPLHLAPVDMQTVFDDVRAALMSDASCKGRDICWQQAHPLPTVLGDLALLRLVLHHVLANAVKFTRGKEPAVIDIGIVDPVDDVVAGVPSGSLPGAATTHIFIRDNGAGYNPAYQGKLFQVFSRLHSATAFEGVGVGLAQCQAAMNRLGGRLTLTGSVGLGCTAVLTLPVAAGV